MALKLAKLQAEENDKTRLFGVIMAPPVLGMLVMAGGLYMANRVTWDSEDGARNADVRAVISAASTMAGLATAGVKDRWILGIAGGAAGLSGLNSVSNEGVASIAGEAAVVAGATAAGAIVGSAVFPVIGTWIGGLLAGGAATALEASK